MDSDPEAAFLDRMSQPIARRLSEAAEKILTALDRLSKPSSPEERKLHNEAVVAARVVGCSGRQIEVMVDQMRDTVQKKLTLMRQRLLCERRSTYEKRKKSGMIPPRPSASRAARSAPAVSLPAVGFLAGPMGADYSECLVIFAIISWLAIIGWVIFKEERHLRRFERCVSTRRGLDLHYLRWNGCRDCDKSMIECKCSPGSG